MADIKVIQDKIIRYIEEHKKEYENISKAIWEKPEVSNYEFFACKVLGDKLREEGFKIEDNAAGHRTGFAAVKKSGKPGPVIAFLAEYDALEGLGHACGHNIIGVTSTFAGVALSKVIDEIGGEARVYGTPGEEGGEEGSAKESFVREGYFKDVDAALIAHPGTLNLLTGTSLANDPIDIEFFGKPAHAAAIPEQGINALDAVIQVYNGINALRQHLPSDVRIHGIITNGGSAPNIVPDYAKARFYLRSASRTTLNDVFAKVERIVEGAGLLTGAKGKVIRYQNKVDNLIPTPVFDEVYKKHLEYFGETLDHKELGMGSTDVGNVSQVVPTIHPTLKVTEIKCGGHTVEFREECVKPKALESCTLGAKILSFTALDLILDSELLKSIKEQHKTLISQV